MENIILSMLIFKAMTIYEIRAYIKRNLTTVCSDSLGSIQTAIKNLIKKGYIDVKEFVDNDIPGVEVFAVDGEGNYFVYNHPTDVRVIREEDRYGAETMRIL